MAFATHYRCPLAVVTISNVVVVIVSIAVLSISIYAYLHPIFDFKYGSTDLMYSGGDHTFHEVASNILFAVMGVSTIMLIISLYSLLCAICSCRKRPGLASCLFVIILALDIIMIIILAISFTVGLVYKQKLKDLIRSGLESAILIGFRGYILPLQQYLKCCNIDGRGPAGTCLPATIGHGCFQAIWDIITEGYTIAIILTIIAICFLLLSCFFVCMCLCLFRNMSSHPRQKTLTAHRPKVVPVDDVQELQDEPRRMSRNKENRNANFPPPERFY